MPGIQRRNTSMDRGGDAVRYTGFFFHAGRKRDWRSSGWRLATHLNPPGWLFFRHLSANSFHFFFLIFFLTLDSPPPSWFNVVNNEALRVPLVGKFFQGGVFLDQPRGHGSRGSAGAGREAVPLCQRGRAARNRRHRPVALEVRCHTSREPPWQWQSRPDGKESSWLLPNQNPPFLACYMQSKNVEMCAVAWWLSQRASVCSFARRKLVFVARSLGIHADLCPPPLFFFTLSVVSSRYLFVSSVSSSTLFDHLPGNWRQTASRGVVENITPALVRKLLWFLYSHTSTDLRMCCV